MPIHLPVIVYTAHEPLSSPAQYSAAQRTSKMSIQSATTPTPNPTNIFALLYHVALIVLQPCIVITNYACRREATATVIKMALTLSLCENCSSVSLQAPQTFFAPHPMIQQTLSSDSPNLRGATGRHYTPDFHHKTS